MNIKEIDPDLPSVWEVKFLTSPFHKLLFLFFQPLFYGVRPLIMFPKTPTVYEAINVCLVFFTDYLVYSYFGANALLWMLCSTFMGMGYGMRCVTYA